MNVELGLTAYSISAFSNRTNKSPPVFYRASSSSGPLPYFLSHQFTIMESRAMGIADHILPLGDLFFVVVSALLINKE